MSINYYLLREPITHLRIIEDTNPIHTKLSVWIDHGLAGTLVVPTSSLSELLLVFAKRYLPALTTYWAGSKRGTGVTVYVDLQDETVLVSENGELFTVEEVKARDGAKRKDGWPTELFGYE